MMGATAGQRISAGYQALTEKEKETLRLIVRGHDAKSTARQLGLSVHTVNERLRDARRKLEVSSSREAARLLWDNERDHPESSGYKQIGEASPFLDAAHDAAQGSRRRPTLAWSIAGAVIMSIILGLLALSFVADGNAPSTGAAGASFGTAAQVANSESEATRSARNWLELSDQQRWEDAYRATADSFRKLNTVEMWTDAAKQARLPLGAVISRTALSQESVPAPPAGVEMVKFRTVFANRRQATETVSLVREGSGWKVVGIYID